MMNFIISLDSCNWNSNTYRVLHLSRDVICTTAAKQGVSDRTAEQGAEEKVKCGYENRFG